MSATTSTTVSRTTSTVAPASVVPAAALVVEDPDRMAGTMLRLITGLDTGTAGDQAMSGPAAVLSGVAAQLDELAAAVEGELGREAAALAAAQALTRSGELQELLEAQHGRRRTVLRLLAQALGEIHGDLEEISARLDVRLGERAGVRS